MTDELLRLARLFHEQLEAPSESEYTDLWYCLITHDVERLTRLLESNGVRTKKANEG